MSAGGFAKTLARLGQVEEAGAACHALIQMGVKMSGSIVHQRLPLSYSDLARFQMGRSAATTGYSDLCDVYQVARDSSKLEMAKGMRDQFIAQCRQFMQRDMIARQNGYGAY
jgi:hypothetical protein